MNRLIHGEALEEMQKLIDKGVKVDAIITDIPYIFAHPTGGGGMLNSRKSHSEIYTNLGGKNLDVGVDVDFVNLSRKLFDKKMFNFVTFCNKAQLHMFINYAEDNNLLYNILIWHKTNPVPTCHNKYLDDIEYIFQMKERGGKKILGNYSTKSKVYTSVVNKKDKKEFGHPTIKPLELMEKLIFNHTADGDMVLDMFMGSGSTGVACKNLNRKFIGIELDEDYYNIAKERIGE